jgi:predicted nucleotide-binding protein (sugar kinase/HSP70/actin superfamily)
LKIWAAKFTARHPNLVAVEISSFKRGHDAPVYSVVQRIIEQSGTPCFCFKDLDENKRIASIKLRVETINYFLKSYREEMSSRRYSKKKRTSRMPAMHCPSTYGQHPQGSRPVRERQ